MSDETRKEEEEAMRTPEGEQVTSDTAPVEGQETLPMDQAEATSDVEESDEDESDEEED